MTKALSQIRGATMPRRGLSRDESAMYLGIGVGLFDELREAGKVAPARVIGNRKLWDIRDLDMAFESLPRENAPAPGLSWDTA
jgi:hypothetical protein